MATSFSDCCIRYGQEYVYMTFSEGNMLLGEIYMSLAYGLIDPACLPAMTIIQHDNKTWCTDTRRLTLAKELENRGRFDVLQLMSVREVKKNAPQYRDFVNHRLPAMHRKGLDGLTIKASDRRGPTCCFNSDNRFRTDLEEHIIRDHLNNFTLELFKNLTIYYCRICKTNTRITCTKSLNRSYYIIIRKCGCKPKKPHQFEKPWSKLSFAELCNGLLQYNHSLKGKFLVQNSISSPDDTKVTFRSTATQTDIVDESLVAVINFGSRACKTTRSIVSSQPFKIASEHKTLINLVQNPSNIESCNIEREIQQENIIGSKSYLSSDKVTKNSEDQRMRDIHKLEILKDSARVVHRHDKIAKRAYENHRRPKSCCNNIEDATERVKQVVNALGDAWNRKDPDGFATLLTEDGESTDVVANHVQGLPATHKLHIYPFTTVLKKAHLILHDISIRFLKADVATIDVIGQTTSDGTKEISPRNSLMSLISLSQSDQT